MTINKINFSESYFIKFTVENGIEINWGPLKVNKNFSSPVYSSKEYICIQNVLNQLQIRHEVLPIKETFQFTLNSTKLLKKLTKVQSDSSYGLIKNIQITAVLNSKSKLISHDPLQFSIEHTSIFGTLTTISFQWNGSEYYISQITLQGFGLCMNVEIYGSQPSLEAFKSAQTLMRQLGFDYKVKEDYCLALVETSFHVIKKNISLKMLGHKFLIKESKEDKNSILKTNSTLNQHVQKKSKISTAHIPHEIKGEIAAPTGNPNSDANYLASYVNQPLKINAVSHVLELNVCDPLRNVSNDEQVYQSIPSNEKEFSKINGIINNVPTKSIGNQSTFSIADNKNKAASAETHDVTENKDGQTSSNVNFANKSATVFSLANEEGPLTFSIQYISPFEEMTIYFTWRQEYNKYFSLELTRFQCGKVEAFLSRCSLKYNTQFNPDMNYWRVRLDENEFSKIKAAIENAPSRYLEKQSISNISDNRSTVVHPTVFSSTQVDRAKTSADPLSSQNSVTNSEPYSLLSNSSTYTTTEDTSAEPNKPDPTFSQVINKSPIAFSTLGNEVEPSSFTIEYSSAFISMTVSFIWRPQYKKYCSAELTREHCMQVEGFLSRCSLKYNNQFNRDKNYWRVYLDEKEFSKIKAAIDKAPSHYLERQSISNVLGSKNSSPTSVTSSSAQAILAKKITIDEAQQPSKFKLIIGLEIIEFVWLSKENIYVTQQTVDEKKNNELHTLITQFMECEQCVKYQENSKYFQVILKLKHFLEIQSAVNTKNRPDAYVTNTSCKQPETYALSVNTYSMVWQQILIGDEICYVIQNLSYQEIYSIALNVLQEVFAIPRDLYKVLETKDQSGYDLILYLNYYEISAIIKNVLTKSSNFKIQISEEKNDIKNNGNSDVSLVSYGKAISRDFETNFENFKIRWEYRVYATYRVCVTKERFSENAAKLCRENILSNFCLLRREEVQIVNTKNPNIYCIIVLMDVLDFKNLIEMNKNRVSDMIPLMLDLTTLQKNHLQSQKNIYSQAYCVESSYWNCNQATKPVDQKTRIQMANTYVDVFGMNSDSLEKKKPFTIRIIYGLEIIELEMTHGGQNQYMSQRLEGNQSQKIAFALVNVLGLIPGEIKSKHEAPSQGNLAIVKSTKYEGKYRIMIWDINALVPVLKLQAELMSIERECNRLLKERGGINTYEKRELLDKVSKFLEHPFSKRIGLQLVESEKLSKKVRLISEYGDKYQIKIIPWENIQSISKAISKYRLTCPFKTLVECEVIQWFPCSDQSEEVITYATQLMENAEAEKLATLYAKVLNLEAKVISIVNSMDGTLGNKSKIIIVDCAAFDLALKKYIINKEIATIP